MASLRLLGLGIGLSTLIAANGCSDDKDDDETGGNDDTPGDTGGRNATGGRAATGGAPSAAGAPSPVTTGGATSSEGRAASEGGAAAEAGATDGGQSPSGAGGEDGGGDGRLYVSSMRVFNPEGSVGYLISLPSLDASAEVDLSKAVEMEDAWVFGNADPYFYTATIFEPTMTRWEVDANGKFTKGPTLDFTNEGVQGTYTAAGTPIWSPEKSYFVDGESLQVVIWDPTEMKLLGTIPIDAEPEGNLVAKWTSGISVTKDRIYVSVFWADGEGAWTNFGEHVRLFAIDPETDEIVEVSDDDRCQTIGPAGTTSDGTAYFSSWDYPAAIRDIFGGSLGSSSCSLRVVPAGTAFDDGFGVDLSSLVGGLPAGSMQLIDDETALIHVWDNSLQEATPEDWEEKRFLNGYYWYRWKIGEDTAEKLPDQAPSAEGGTFIQLDGKTFNMGVNEEYEKTTVQELRADGTFASGIVIPGWATNVIRAH
jgi:hypothetical protein